MNTEEAKELILKKISPMKRMDIEKSIFDIFSQYPEEVSDEFRENYLDAYEVEHPSLFALDINDIVSRDTQMGLLFKDLLKVTSDKIGAGEVLFVLCMKGAISGGTENTDIILEDGKKYEIKKVSKGGIFSFSERFTEYNDLGLILNMAILNFGHLGIFNGKNLYTTSTKEVRSFKMLLEKFLLPGEDGVPFYKDQFVVKINGDLKKVNGSILEDPLGEEESLEAYHSMFNFRDQVLLSKIKDISMDLFKRGCGGETCTKEIVHDLFSITALKQILKGVEGIFFVLPDYTVSYFTPHEDHDSLYDPREIYLYDISRNKMNFKGPFLSGTRAERTAGEIPLQFQLMR